MREVPCTQRRKADAHMSFLEVHRVKYVAHVNIQLRQSVLDPQGETVRSALASMGYGGVQKVRIGKRIRVELEAASTAECREIVDEISRRVLVTTNMETYEYEIRDESGE